MNSDNPSAFIKLRPKAAQPVANAADIFGDRVLSSAKQLMKTVVSAEGSQIHHDVEGSYSKPGSSNSGLTKDIISHTQIRDTSFAPGSSANAYRDASSHHRAEPAYGDFQNGDYSQILGAGDGPPKPITRTISLAPTIDQQEVIDGIQTSNLLNQSMEIYLEASSEYTKEAIASSDTPPATFNFGLSRSCMTKEGIDEYYKLIKLSPDVLNYSNDPEIFVSQPNFQEARLQWLNQWQRVLENYCEEVWGESDPLTIGFKQDLHESRYTTAFSSDPNGENGALNRLEQILTHIRRTTVSSE